MELHCVLLHGGVQLAATVLILLCGEHNYAQSKVSNGQSGHISPTEVLVQGVVVVGEEQISLEQVEVVEDIS